MAGKEREKKGAKKRGTFHFNKFCSFRISVLLISVLFYRSFGQHRHWHCRRQRCKFSAFNCYCSLFLLVFILFWISNACWIFGYAGQLPSDLFYLTVKSLWLIYFGGVDNVAYCYSIEKLIIQNGFAHSYQWFLKTFLQFQDLSTFQLIFKNYYTHAIYI